MRARAIASDCIMKTITGLASSFHDDMVRNTDRVSSSNNSTGWRHFILQCPRPRYIVVHDIGSLVERFPSIVTVPFLSQMFGPFNNFFLPILFCLLQMCKSPLFDPFRYGFKLFVPQRLLTSARSTSEEQTYRAESKLTCPVRYLRA